MGAPPAENQGFLRDDARLAIVMLTNEDDCSPRAGQALFDTASNNSLASPLGPPTSFRCNEFGHLCGGMAPGRVAPNGRVGDMFTYDSCEPAEDAGMLKTVADTAGQIRALKADPASQILMASIQGSTGPYTVHWRDPLPPDTMPWPEMAHSCTGLESQLRRSRHPHGEPGVRLRRQGVRVLDLRLRLRAAADAALRRRSAVCSRRRASPTPSPTI